MIHPQSSPAAELLDIVDEHDRVIGQAPRGDAYAHLLRHRCVFVLVRDQQNRIFVHRRARHKLVFPSRYDLFVGGAVAAGESYDEAARRESAEELGVSRLPPTPVPLVRFLYESAEHALWCAVYRLHCDLQVDPPADEVSWFSFLTEAVLHERLSDWPWAPDSLEAYRRLRPVSRVPFPRRLLPRDRCVADEGHG